MGVKVATRRDRHVRPRCRDSRHFGGRRGCHQSYAKHNHIHFPLLADFHPKGAAAQQYGAYREQDGVCERALFVIDRKGVIFWSYLSPIAVNPGADGILDALESLQNQEK
jgi:peroxiredoxin